jgi:serine phosphatase RsbU (regulator of sigma subunit)
MVEAANSKGEEFGEVRLAEFITTCQNLPVEEFAERLLNEVLAWPANGSTATQADDITIVVIDIDGPGE